MDHIEARAFGGEGTPENLRLRCKPHNRLHAEQDFGREHVKRETEKNQALSGLVKLGFKRSDAKRALDTVLAGNEALALPDVLREAIGLLT